MTATFDDCLTRTPLPRRVLGIAAVGGAAVVFDGYDLQALSYALPKIVPEWHIPPVQAGLLASYTFIGLFLGAVGLGALGDRWGRRKMLVLGVTVFALFMGTAGFAQDYAQFAVLRFCASIGMGGVLPGAIAVLGEFVPVRSRGRMVAAAGGCFTFGFLVAAAVATLVVPAFGWRPLFHLSYAALLIAVLIYFLLPDSPQFLATRSRYAEAVATVRKVYPQIWPTARDADPATFFAGPRTEDGKIQFRALWTRERRPTTLTVSLLYLFLQFVVYALDFWMVSLLVRHGLSLVSSYSYAIEQAAAATLGGLVLGWLLDRINPYTALAVSFAAGAVCLVLFGITDSVVALYALNALAGAFIIGGQNAVHTLVLGAYGPEARATALGWALGIGRLGGLLGPLIGGVLLAASLPFPVYFLAFAVPSLLCAVTVVVLRTVRSGHREPQPLALDPEY
jgi:MFS transporter, AAHS family, benzoate transport protein